MKLLIVILLSMLDVVPSGKAFLNQLQPRDSILIADQLEYGFNLDGVKDGTQILLPDYSRASNDTLTLVRGWKVDTVKTDRRAGTRDLRAAIILAPFEEGEYQLPVIYALRTEGGVVDTLEFEALEMSVTTIQIDTATFIPHDIKGQIGYPLTFKELLPYLIGAVLLALLVAAIIALVKRHRARVSGEKKSDDPPYVVALRKLDRFRGDRYWAPDKQKFFYSGVTDTLKEYIDGRFGVDAPEMTTAELFDAIKTEKDISPDLYVSLKELFERADFVKFAKMVVSDQDNATVLPLAVKFVTDTYQNRLQEEEEASGEKDVL